MQTSIMLIIIFDMILTTNKLVATLKGRDIQQQNLERSEQLTNQISTKSNDNIIVLSLIALGLLIVIVYSTYEWFKILAIATNSLIIPTIYIGCDMLETTFKPLTKLAYTCKLAIMITILRII